MFRSKVEKSLPSVYKRMDYTDFLCAKLRYNSVIALQQNLSNSGANNNILNAELGGRSISVIDQKVKCLIIDCSALAYCDYSGAATLVELIEELEDRKVNVYLAACSIKLIGMFERLNKGQIIESNIYPTIPDAVNRANYLRTSRNSRSPPTILTQS